MRTKTLVLSALLGLATIGTSMAQVYSLNTVGYVNITLTNGFNLVANQLDLDGTGNSNTLLSVLGTNWPNSTKLWAWNGTQYKTLLWIGGKWSGASTNELTAAVQPGQGLFIQIPTSIGPTNITLTLVGNVLTGTNTASLPVGYNMVSSRYPRGGNLVSDLTYGPNANDRIWQWNQASQQWTSRLKIGNGATWSSGGVPIVDVGQAMFIQNAVSTNWTQTLNITP